MGLGVGILCQCFNIILFYSIYEAPCFSMSLYVIIIIIILFFLWFRDNFFNNSPQILALSCEPATLSDNYNSLFLPMTCFFQPL